MTFRDALLIGLAQCCSLIPGVSRAGATIIGGMLCGLSRKAATEFSFFLAVPTLIAAGGYDLLKHRGEFSADDIEVLAVGLIVSFISALICIRWLLRYVASHTFNIFAWYRIILGVDHPDRALVERSTALRRAGGRRAAPPGSPGSAPCRRPLRACRRDEATMKHARDLRPRLEPEDHGARALLVQHPGRLLRLQPGEIPAQRREAARARLMIAGAWLLKMEIADG